MGAYERSNPGRWFILFFFFKWLLFGRQTSLKLAMKLTCSMTPCYKQHGYGVDLHWVILNLPLWEKLCSLTPTFFSGLVCQIYRNIIFSYSRAPILNINQFCYNSGKYLKPNIMVTWQLKTDEEINILWCYDWLIHKNFFSENTLLKTLALHLRCLKICKWTFVPIL